MQGPSSKINYDALKKLSDEEDVSFILLPCFTVNLSFFMRFSYYILPAS